MVDDDVVTVNIVEVELTNVRFSKFNVIVPGPVNVTEVELPEPEHSSPPEQLQLEIL